MLLKMFLEMALKKVEKRGNWGKGSRSEFIDSVKLAHEEKLIDDKTTFNFIMRAMAI